jgi:hypothetical protein
MSELNGVGSFNNELNALQNGTGFPESSQVVIPVQDADKQLVAQMMKVSPHVAARIVSQGPTNPGNGGPKPEFWLPQSTQSPQISQPIGRTRAVAARRLAEMRAAANDKNNNSTNTNRKPEFWLRNK